MTAKSLNSKTITYEELAKVIDHSLLKPQLTKKEVIEGIELAKRYHVKTVTVRPCDVRLAAKICADSDVLVDTVVGFPHGDTTTLVKVVETKDAVANGAVEIDMVLNIGELRSGNYDYVRDDIQAVVEAAGDQAIVKVILENAFLTPEEIEIACKLSEEAGAAFVKTSTGFAPGGATVEDIKLMRKTVSDKVEVKAAGGVRSLDAAFEMIDLGVTRIGATATSKILDEFERRKVKGWSI